MTKKRKKRLIRPVMSDQFSQTHRTQREQKHQYVHVVKGGTADQINRAVGVTQNGARIANKVLRHAGINISQENHK